MFLLWFRQLPRCGDRTPVSVPPPAKGSSSPTNTPVFPLISFILPVFLGSIYYFPLVRYSCLLSSGVLRALLCLKVYSWCILGERCIPCPPTPPPSCSPLLLFLFLNLFSNSSFLLFYPLSTFPPLFYSPFFPSLFLFSPSKLNCWAVFALFPSWHSVQVQFSRLSII